jgi:hypothetical protein
MEWWWCVPAAAGICMAGAFYRSRNPRMAGREGGPAFETFYDVRECLRGGVTPILPEGWRYWRYEVVRELPRRAAVEAVQNNMAKLKAGDRVWLIADQRERRPKGVKAISKEGFLGFVKVGSACWTAILAGRVAAFVQAVESGVSGHRHVELLVLQSPVPLESSTRVSQSSVSPSVHPIELPMHAGRGRMDEFGQTRSRGSG